MIVILFRTGLFNFEHCSRFKNALPNLDNGLNWRFVSTTRALPEIEVDGIDQGGQRT